MIICYAAQKSNMRLCFILFVPLWSLYWWCRQKGKNKALKYGQKGNNSFFFVLHVNEENYGEEQSFSLSS